MWGGAGDVAWPVMVLLWGLIILVAVLLVRRLDLTTRDSRWSRDFRSSILKRRYARRRSARKTPIRGVEPSGRDVA